MKQFVKIVSVATALVLCLSMLSGCSIANLNGSSAFNGDCGISASATYTMYEAFSVRVNELKLFVINMSSQDIVAIRFYVQAYDVYGEQVSLIPSDSHFTMDKTLAIDSNTTIYRTMTGNSIKSIKLYVYSVYFADGTEWGDHNASEAEIVKYASTINVANKSR